MTATQPPAIALDGCRALANAVSWIFRLDVGEMFTKRVMSWWNRLPKEVADAPSLEIFKAKLDGVLGSLT